MQAKLETVQADKWPGDELGGQLTPTGLHWTWCRIETALEAFRTTYNSYKS